MKGFQITIFVALGIVYLDSSLSQQITCKETMSFERGERGVVSCQYNMNFIAVFWYRGDAGNPFLRLEEGRPTTTSERFTIAPNGTMIIGSVEITDEGVYRISVLDENGVSVSEHVNVKVTVPLSTQPVIENCATSKSALCQDIREDNGGNVLVCETLDTRPKVNLTWWRMSSSGDSYMSKLPCYASMNQSTGLFTSWSVFSFDPETFSIGYFTCKATGEAVRGPKESSLFVQGLKDTEVEKRHKDIIEIGMTLELSCSDKTHPLLSWSFIQGDGTVQTLQTIYPGKRSGACSLGTACYVNEYGTLTVREVSHLDAGIFECLYSDGNTSSRSVYEIDILNKPDPEEIVIDGCKNNTKCEKAVALTGTIKTSIHGARPPVEILCEVADESTAFIYNHESRVEDHPEEGTFDTFYSVDFDIDECSQPVHISCMAPYGSVHETLPASNIYLFTDTSSCSSEKGPWVAIVLIIIFVTLIVAATIVLYVKRKQVRDFQERCFQYTTVRQSDSDHANADTETTPPAQDKKDEAKKREYKDGERFLSDEIEDLSTTGTKNILCHQFCDVIYKSKNVPGEELINQYTTKDEHTKPFHSVSDHLISSPHEKETLYAVVNYLVTLMPNQSVPHVDLCVLLSQLVSQNMMPGDKFLVVINALRAKKLLLLEKYIEMTGPLLNSSDIDRSTVITNLKHLMSKGLVTKEELVETLLQYFSFYTMETKAILREVTELKSSSYKIPYPYFLQGIFKMQDKIGHTLEQTCALLTLYNDIVKVHITNKEESLLIQIDKEKPERQEICYPYVQAMFSSTAEGAIDCGTCWNMIVDEIKNQKMEKEKLLHMWNRMFNEEQINRTPAVDILRLLRNENQVTHAQFNETLCEARKKIQISSEMFKKEIVSAINKKGMDQGEWIKFTVDKWKETLISNDEKSHYMVAIADTYKISRDSLKSELEKLGMNRDERRAFLRPIPLKGD